MTITEGSLPEANALFQMISQSPIARDILDSEPLFVAVAREQKVRRLIDDPVFQCVMICVGCVAAIATYAANLLALVGCAVLTPACILAILGHPVAAAMVAFACTGCFDCILNTHDT